MCESESPMLMRIVGLCAKNWHQQWICGVSLPSYITDLFALKVLWPRYNFHVKSCLALHTHRTSSTTRLCWLLSATPSAYRSVVHTHARTQSAWIHKSPTTTIKKKVREKSRVGSAWQTMLYIILFHYFCCFKCCNRLYVQEKLLFCSSLWPISYSKVYVQGYG